MPLLHEGTPIDVDSLYRALASDRDRWRAEAQRLQLLVIELQQNAEKLPEADESDL